MVDYSVHIVIDNGGSTVKSGFNGENAPRAVTPTILGISDAKNSAFNLIADPSRFYIGNEAFYNWSNLNISRPIRGGVMDVEKMEKIWSHIFKNELKVKPEAHNVFLTESLHNSNREREKIAEIMFEKFSIFNIHIEAQQVMSLYSTTKTSGLIIESGEAMTEVVPIYEGYIIPQGIKYNNIAGEKLTSSFLESISHQLKQYNVCNLFQIAKKVKEKYAEVCLNKVLPKEEILKYELPDGNSINIGNERFTLPEAIFNPDIINADCQSIQDLVANSIKNVDIHVRKEFLSNIVLGGGNTMIKNFNERLKKELQKLYYKDDEPEPEPENNFIKINAQNERIYSSWVGASVVCSISNFQQMWVSKNDYEEIGPSVIHKKYFY